MDGYELILLVTASFFFVCVSGGEINNPFYSIFEPGKSESRKHPHGGHSEDSVVPKPKDPPLDALRFMTTVDHNAQPGIDASKGSAHTSSDLPSPPGGMGTLFGINVPSNDDFHGDGNKEEDKGQRNGGELTKDQVPSFPNLLTNTRVQLHTVKNDGLKSSEMGDNSRALPAVFALSRRGSTTKKIRRRKRKRKNRHNIGKRLMSKESHRKMKLHKTSVKVGDEHKVAKARRHQQHLSRGRAHELPIELHNSKSNILKRPSMNIESHVSISKDTQPSVHGVNGKTRRDEVKLHKPEADNFYADWPLLGHIRTKRAAFALRQLSLPSYTYDQNPPAERTFYYRMPSGGNFRDFSSSRVSHSHLLRTTDDEMTDDSDQESLAEAGEVEPPSEPVQEQVENKMLEEEKLNKEEAEGEGLPSIGGGDHSAVTTHVPIPHNDNNKNEHLSSNKDDSTNNTPAPSSSFQEASSSTGKQLEPLPSPENNSTTTGVNATVPRHLLRSPMLVDYGSRVKPQDIVLPTDPPVEEEEGEGLAAEGEEQVEEEELEGEDKIVDNDDVEDLLHEAKESEPAAEAEEEEAILAESTGEMPKEDLEETQPEQAEPETETVHINPSVDGGFHLPDQAGHEPEPEPEVEPESDPQYPLSEGEEGRGGTDMEPERERGEQGEPESTSEPESEAEQPGPEGVTYAEPQPEWIEAKKEWGPWWEVHIYGIGLAYAVLCTYSFVSIIRLWRRKNLLSQGYFIALNCIMFTMGFFRAIYFLVDGYNSNGTFTAAGHYFLYSIGFPCLTSAFSILLLALLNTLKMQLVSPKIQRTSILIGIIIGHFVFSIATDVIVGYLATAKVMMFVCQVTTVLWALFLFAGYIYVFRQLYKAAVWRQNEFMRISLAKIKMEGIAPITKPPKMTLNVAVKVTLATAIFGLLLAALQTYGLIAVNSIFSAEVPSPWTWLLYNTGLRLTELAMCITMSYVATQPFRYKQAGKVDEHHSSCVNALFYMAPCRRMFECDAASLYGDDLDYTDFPTHGDHMVEQADGSIHISVEESTPMTASGRAAQAAAAAAVAGQSGENFKENNKKSNKVVPRPASLLVSENGFIRFREDEESGGSPVLLSTDDELENNSVENMLRNPFYRDLLRRQEKERAVGRATFVNSDGITLQDEFGLAESITDQDLIPPPRPTFPIRAGSRGCNTGTNTPGTPRSFCSTDLEYAASEISYRPPSSIHLRDSIENALNIPGFTLKTPDILDSPLTMAYLRTRRHGSRPTGSMNDLESLRHYGPVSKYSDSHDTIDFPSERAASPDSMYSYTLSNLTRAPLVRSYSDSIGRTSLAEASIPNSPERQYYKARVQASMLKNNPENSNQFQNLLRNINDMCNVYNKLSPDDREGDE